MQIFVLMSVLFVFLNSYGLQSEIGGSSNTRFEEKSCEQLIRDNLRYQSESGLNQRAIDQAKQSCPENAFYDRRRKENCLQEIENGLNRNYRDMMNGFVGALEVRRNNYDIINIKSTERVNITPECRNANARSLVRSATMSDNAYIVKLRYNCKLTPEYEINGRKPLIEIYRESSGAVLADREKCQRFLVEYTNILYPRSASSRTVDPASVNSQQNVAPLHSTASRYVRLPGCKPVNCEYINSNLTNNPSPCYRDSYMACATGNEVQPGTTNRGGSVSTGN